MGKVYDGIDQQLAEWIGKQHVFFAATAPAFGGHINCSPKGLHALRIVDEHTVAYLDLTGSGIETVAHLRADGRIVLMFCAFEGPPRIVRLHGHGEVAEIGERDFDEKLKHFRPLDDIALASARAVIMVKLDRISDSCGYGVPLMRFENERTQSTSWSINRLKNHGSQALSEYRAEKNESSIDGLPGLRSAARMDEVVSGERVRGTS